MDKFLEHTAEEFALEESFINWVKETHPNDINFWNKFLLDHPEKKESMHKARRIVESLNFVDEGELKIKEDKLWNKIAEATREEKVVEQKRTSVLRYLLPLAAAAIVGFIVFVNLPQTFTCDTNISSALAETNQIILPDNSVVTVNADSELCYSKADWANNRIVQLDGEAFFEVEKGSKFLVKTDNGEVEVLGTSFNVYSRDDRFFVQCETGKVEVRSQGKETILMPQESAALDKSTNELDKIETTLKRSDWRTGTFSYSDEKLGQVLQDVERTFGVTIEKQQDINETLYNGEFTSQNVDSALYQILWPLNLEVVKRDDNFKVQRINQ